MSRSLEDKIQDLKNTLDNVKEQLSCEHDRGLYNGLEYALSVLEGRSFEPIDRLPPPPIEVQYFEQLEELLKRLRANPLQK